MALRNSLARGLVSLLLLIGVASALKFDVQAHPGRENQKKERCIRNFVAKDTLVVVTATVGGSRGDGMTLNIHVRPLSRARADTIPSPFCIHMLPFDGRPLPHGDGIWWADLIS